LQSTLFGSSPLVRAFGAWMPADAQATGADAAERLAHWVGPLDAIRLQAVHHALRASTAGGASSHANTKAATTLAEDVERARGVLARAIAQDPLRLAAVPPGEDAGYGPWQQRHIELQRQMAQMLGALRDHARQAVSRASPRLRQLAVLDAAFEELLAAREQSLLPTTLTLLERRYHQLRKANAAAVSTGDEGEAPAPATAAGWLATFATDWRQALLAELELRLEPVAGLLDALRHESGTPTT
jgi:hypothetical protein